MARLLPGLNGAADVGRVDLRRFGSGVGARDEEDWVERSDEAEEEEDMVAQEGFWSANAKEMQRRAETKRGIIHTFLTRYRSGGTPLQFASARDQEALRAVARGTGASRSPSCSTVLTAAGCCTATLAQNNQGHGNHDHPGSKLKNFQNTNPPMFSKTEEPLDADDWLQTIENNLEVAGVEAAEKYCLPPTTCQTRKSRWTRAMNAGQMMTWEDFKLKFSKYHVPQGLIKKMRDEFRELKQGRMSVVEYRDRFLTLSRYAPDETDTNEKRKERFLNGLHDEMETVLVNIPLADLEALVDSAIQMEGKLHQANENRKRRMMNQSGPHHTQKHRNNSSGGFTPRNNRPPAQTYRTNHSNNNGGTPKPGGNNNNNNNHNSHNNNGNNPNTNTGPRTGSNAIPVTPKDKSTVNCYECGVVGHYSKECPKKLAKIAANTAAPAQQQRR
ncbi:hypothetical protein QYE76_008099 [Lolium multiflorum]|uniref:CCHC-type domain-containing protein n=1 Tax=Lolium multiflorum TaxID=4521 RepID=A0AAD8Q3B0_LOLMU|nr:hypothetical protein QYE76_008099 [Lolium multiflorum]